MAGNFQYPVTTFEDAVSAIIYEGNQVGDIINGTGEDEVTLYDGSRIPALRKALIDNFYFKSPIDWKEGSTETVFNQLRYFKNDILSGYYYAPGATASNPITMGTTPVTDPLWRLYDLQSQETPSQVHSWSYDTATGDELEISPPYVFDTAIVAINGIVQEPNVAYTIVDSKIVLVEPLGNDPETGEANRLFAYLGKLAESPTNYIERAILAQGSGSSLVGYYTQTVQSAIDSHFVTTSSRGIRAANATSDNTTALQALVNANLNVMIDTPVNITAPIELKNDHQVVKASTGGRVNVYTDAMAGKSMFVVTGQFVKIENVTFDNVNSLKIQTIGAGRQGGIDIRNNYCTVQGCTFWRCLNSVFSSSSYGAYGTKVLNNYFLECLGGGDGINDTVSNRGEDRGDAVTIWGSGSVIIGNHAYAKAGEDGRIAFHAEFLPGTPSNKNEEFDHKDVIMVGNMAYGSWRRHFVLENMSNSLCVGNVSMGGATWWCEAYVNCKNVLAENVLRFTRPSTDHTGGYWSPTPGCTALVNSSKSIEIRSVGYLDVGSSGSGFVIQTVKDGTHRYSVKGRYVNYNGSTSSVAISLLTSERGIFEGCYLEGFSKGMSINLGTGSYVSVNSCFFDLLGNSAGILCNYGVGGKVHVSNTIILNTNAFANISNADEVLLSNNKGLIIDGGYFVNLFSIKQTFRMSECISIDKNATVRYGGSTSGTIPNINWDISNNMNIIADWFYTEGQLQDSTKMVNTINKTAGKIIVATPNNLLPSNTNTRNTYIALGGNATSAWRSLNIASLDTNNNLVFSTITPTAPATV